MIRRTILEWQRIAYGDENHQIPEWAADRIAEVARYSSFGGEAGGRVLAHGRRDLRAGQVVGVLAAEGCALEILPKIDGLGDGENDGSRRQIRQQLVHMLAIVSGLEISSGAITQLGWQRENLLEILIYLFAGRLTNALRQGMPRRYVGCEENLPALRGRLNVIHQFTKHAASPQRLACCFESFSTDIALNRIMKAVIVRLLRISRSLSNQRQLRELEFAYADISDLPVSMLRWDQVVLDRTNARWHELLGLARLLLGERFQTTSLGSSDGFSLLFEMNTLFEEFVARMLARALRTTDLHVIFQGGGLYCLEEESELCPGVKRFQTKPDIIVKRGSETLLVIDTKWKRLSPRIDDAKQGIAQADIYQMMAYSQIYSCPRVILLYPHHTSLGGQAGINGRYRIASGEDILLTATIDVSGKQVDILSCLRRICEGAMQKDWRGFPELVT